MTSVDDGYSSQQGREEVLRLGVKVVSISGAKGKKIIEVQQWKSQPYQRAPKVLRTRAGDFSSSA
jgi:hypothetical protein